MTEHPKCSKFPNKIYHVSKKDAYAHYHSLKRHFGAEVMTPWTEPYPCGDHWHVGRDWRRFNKQLKNALRVGSATSRRQKRVKKRR